MGNYLINPFTSKLDSIKDLNEQNVYDLRYLLLDQTTPQSVINGTPSFYDLKVPRMSLGSPTYSTINDFCNSFGSCGRKTGGTITDATGGYVAISAGTAPLKFTSGTLLTAAEAGTIEYLSGLFYIRGTEGLAFGAATEYINSANAGYLDLNAATGIRVNTAVTLSSITTIGGTVPVADGTYTVGLKLTPVTGTDGTITVKSGIITAIQPAT